MCYMRVVRPQGSVGEDGRIGWKEGMIQKIKNKK